MERALQAILINGKKMKEDVLNNRKKVTIRRGHRDYTEGPVLIGCHYEDWATMRKIINVRHIVLREVTVGEFMDDGFQDSQELYEGLRKIYLDLTWDSPVTVVRWSN